MNERGAGDAHGNSEGCGAGGAFPTPEQELLLRAALLPAPAALAAWRAWQSRVSLERELDASSFRLLSLLYSNLRRIGASDPSLGKLKGIYRRVWYQNQLLFHSAAAVLRALHSAGLETIILKGAALTILHYGDYGLRPMSDFDVLVPAHKRRAAIDVLASSGWQPMLRPSDKLTDSVLDIRQAWGFENAQQQQFDLHWHVLKDSRAPNADDDFWLAAVPLQVADVPARALNPTDQLLHVCVHGLVWDSTPPIRWVSDALTILNGSLSELDWTRMVAQACKHHVTIPLRAALAYLSDSFAAAIPPQVLADLSTAPVWGIERRYYRALASQPGLLGFIPVLWYRYRLDLAAAGRTGIPSALLGFPRYLQYEQVYDRRELLAWAISRAFIRLGRSVRGARRSHERNMTKDAYDTD